MPEDQAEVLANGQADLYELLVTKQHFEFTLSHELEELRAELKHDIEKVRANLEQVKAELKHDIDKVQANLEMTSTELKRDIQELKRDIKEMEQKLTIKLGAFLVIGVTVLTVLDKLFQAPCPCGSSDWKL